MKSIAQKKRYLQHEMTTKLHAVKLYRDVNIIIHIIHRFSHDSRLSQLLYLTKIKTQLPNPPFKSRRNRVAKCCARGEFVVS